MKKAVIRFGLYSAITISVLFILSLTLAGELDYTTQEIIGYASMVVSLGFVYLGIKHFRDKENNGSVSFGKALIIGVLISLFAALAFGILDLIYIKYINPDFTTEYYNRTLSDLEASLPAIEFEEKRAELESEKALFMNPWFSFLLMSMTVFVIGFIISLISALLLQRKN
ncbi:MAG: DUF4199 domain-containing protein [Eudoraea sp.]|nr:DUF4199 domain-containing protein [Eudoraea sp.]